MKALYLGRFDPFTNGHLEIIKQAEEFFDQVIIYQTYDGKDRTFRGMSCIQAIKPFLSMRTEVYNGPENWSDSLAKQLGCDYIVRGLRNTDDWLHEERLYHRFREVDKDTKVVYFRGGYVSGTLVRTLYLERGSKAIRQYVPYDPDKLLLL